MEGGISADASLDYASFQTCPTQNRYEVFVCYKGKREKLASGLLEQLLLHLPQLKDSRHEEPGDHLKLQLPENLKGSTWFNKSTLSRFFHIVGVPEFLENANAIGDEISQLEEVRKVNLALYAQGKQDEHQSVETDSSNSKDLGLPSKLEVQTTSDATKSELLRAIDLRLAVLREKLIAAFRHAADGPCSSKQIADLVEFSQCFGAVELRSSLSKYLELGQEKQNVDPQNEHATFSQDSRYENEKTKEGTGQLCSPVVKPIIYGASPAKVAQVERHSSTESEESSNSGAEDQPYIERSRSLVRSASPRRSASPMRRVQIGRSGSRRATALTIKSLSYIPAKEKISSNKDAAGNSSDEESVQPHKKPESNASSMSVKDAISLFERKQRDQSSDLQKKRSVVDTSVNTSKSVLRRWSAGMGDPPAQSSAADSCESFDETRSSNLVDEKIQNTSLEVSPDRDATVESTRFAKNADEGASLATEEENAPYSISTENPKGNGLAQAVETNDKVSSSADWSRQKEDELNLMMMKMMESKPIKNRTMGSGVSRSQELPSRQRGGLYDHYKQKRDEKLRGENSGKRTEKEDKIKTLQGILEQRKVETSSKSVGVAGKQDSLVRSRKSQKNPSPPLQPRKESSKGSSPLGQPKKESPKPAAPKKISPKASPLPATRKSWPSAPSPKTSVIAPNKTPNWISSTGTKPTRRKSQPTPLPVQSSPKVEKSQQKPKNSKGTQIENKSSSKDQEGKKQLRPVTKPGNVTEAKDLQASVDSSSLIPAKPSFYNKVTKKGSVVPLESKPFLRKRSGAGPGVGPVKTKASQSDEPLSNGNMVQPEEAVLEISKPISLKEEDSPISPISDVINSPHQENEDAEKNNQFVTEGEKAEESPEEIQPENESAISPAAWVEIEEHQEQPTPQVIGPTNFEPVPSSSPRVRHSLSQMLQEDSSEPEIIEWGNAENPPAIVYQKDAAKGLKRLLKFARKSKGEANATGWSDGEDDNTEEPKAASKRHVRTSLGASYDSSQNTNYTTLRDRPSGQSNMTPSETASSTKGVSATRSFFSLSTFRSSKSNETKLR